MKKLVALLLLSLLGGVVSCTPVQPWQKEHLALRHMAFETDPLEAKFKEHIYSSKEGSSGGYGPGGGGCGCN